MTRARSNKNLPVIARRLREAREEVGISQKTLGIRAGIDEFSSSARVNQYERGKHIPDYSTLERFASVLEIPVEYFYARNDTTAELLLLLHNLSPQQKSQVISYLKKLGKRGM